MNNLCFTPEAWQDYLSWQQDKRIMKRINELIRDVQRNPFSGIGKPEGLKGNLSGFWSRRITDEHRLIYMIKNNDVIISSLRDHY